MTVDILSVSKLVETLVEDIEELGGEVTNVDKQRSWVDGRQRVVYWEVEAYFPYEATEFHKTEMSLDDIVDGTGWEYDSCWDMETENERGVLFERFR